MNVIKVLSILRRRHLKISTDGSVLRIAGLPGMVDEQLRTVLAQHKKALICYLSQLRGNPGPLKVGEEQLSALAAQQRLVMLHHLFPHEHWLVRRRSFHLRGPCCALVLERALHQSLDESDVFALGCRMEADRLTIYGESPGMVELRFVSLDCLNPADGIHLWRSLCRPLPDGYLPRVEATLVQLGGHDFLLDLGLPRLFFDDRACDLFIRRWWLRYRACLQDDQVGFDPLPRYADFLRERQFWLAGALYGARLLYWKQLLANYPRALEFPEDRPAPRWPRMACDLHFFPLPDGPVDYHALLTCFALGLRRLTGQDRFMMGIPVDGRQDACWQEAFGYFADLQILPIDLSQLAHLSFGKLSLILRQLMEEGRRYGGVPFESLIEECGAQGQVIRHPLVQVSFEVRGLESSAAPGLWPRELAPVIEVSPFELSLVVEQGHRPRCYLRYNLRLFKRESIACLARLMCGLLVTGLREPDVCLGDFEPLIVGPASLVRVAVRPVASVVAQFERQVVRQGAELAARFQNTSFTYGDLNSRVHQLVLHLRQHGVLPGDRVGLYLDRSLEVIVALLAVLRCGAAFVPLDPTHPLERRRHIIGDARPKLILSDAPASTLGGRDVPVISPVDLADHPDACSRTLDAGEIPAALPAYLFYVSAEQGRAKGVHVTQGGLARFLVALGRQIGFGAEDTFAAVTSLSFGAATTELLLPLVHGGLVLMVSRGVATDGKALSRVLSHGRVSTMQATPFIWNRLLRAGGYLPAKAMITGEPLPLSLARSFLKRKVVPWFMYGPAEAGPGALLQRISELDDVLLAGRSLIPIHAHILDDRLRPVFPGMPGNLYFSGDGLASGYQELRARTAVSFVPHPDGEGTRLFRTGDVARKREDGSIQILGQLDKRVVLQGRCIHLEEIEAELRKISGVRQALALIRRLESRQVLLAYVVGDAAHDLEETELLAELACRLPGYMLPMHIVQLNEFSLQQDGKVDLQLLPLPRNCFQQPPAHVRPRQITQRVIAGIWRKVLGIEEVGIHDHFFDLGGTSLGLLQVFRELPEIIRCHVTLQELFKHPTIAEMTRQLNVQGLQPAEEGAGIEARHRAARKAAKMGGSKIAIIGMALRLPGAGDPETFWRNLMRGRCSISHFNEDELLSEGLPPDLVRHPSYVKSRAMLSEFRCFDAAFFGFTPLEAQITDPQQRLFLECAWEAIESAGYAPQRCGQSIGIYGGVGLNHYLSEHLLATGGLLNQVGGLSLMIGNGIDNLCSRVSFKLGLTGPGVVVQTNCSTSLVAVHMASQALLNRDCRMALAGAVDLGELYKTGYRLDEGLPLSPDGLVRPFDRRAGGTVPGQGATMVLLKRLEDALVDGDLVHAVIRGSAINNDGASKKSYTGYAVEGQKRVYREAYAAARIRPGCLGLIETSSTASPVGDPIEVTGLTEVFREYSRRCHGCYLGAVKANIGNVGVASGIAALIKVVLALKSGMIPPQLYANRLNPEIALADSPFLISSHAARWPRPNKPRVAAVSSFGMGGTNAHVVLQEAGCFVAEGSWRPFELLTFSARSAEALDALTQSMAAHLEMHPRLNFGDLAFTLGMRNLEFTHRRTLVCRNLAEAVLLLASRDPKEAHGFVLSETQPPPLCFVFPGDGVQFHGMGKQLEATEPYFAHHVRRCRQLLGEKHPDLLQGLVDRDRADGPAAEPEPVLEQLALFVYQYALFRLLCRWGLEPDLLMGDRFGEYVAATVAGVFTLPDAIDLVVARGRLLVGGPRIETLVVDLPARELEEVMTDGLFFNMSGTAGRSLVSGTRDRLEVFSALLSARNIQFHHHLAPRMLFPYLHLGKAVRLVSVLEKMVLSKPRITLLSSLTGQPLTYEEATDPHYWVRQVSRTCFFADSLGHTLADERRVILEISPSKQLSILAMGHHLLKPSQLVLTAMSQSRKGHGEIYQIQETLGRLWLNGCRIDWELHHADRPRTRMTLPTYPFEKQRFWIDRPHSGRLIALAPDQLSEAGLHEDHQPYRPNVTVAYVPPGNAVEERLVEQFQEMLGLDQVGIHDDFFELGGDSLTAHRLMDRLGRLFHIPTSSHVLLKYPCVARLADFVATYLPHKVTRKDAERSPLVEIQKGKPGRPPVILVHPVGGEIYFYRDLALNLGQDQPVLGFQAASLFEGHPPQDNIPEQAACYVAELLRQRPTGPFFLGGASYGGVVAYEMAHQLMQQGHKVEFLVMIDSPGPGSLPRALQDSAEILSYLLADKLPLDVSRLRALANEDEQLALVMEVARGADQLNALPPHLGKPMLRTWLAHQRGLLSYQPKPYSGHVLYFTASERMKRCPPNMHLGWIDLVQGGIEIYRVPGNHITMNHHRNVKVTAHHIRQQMGIRDRALKLPN